MFTYTGDPGVAGTAAATAQNNLDAVRLCIDDTNPDAQLLQDGEINWFLLQECGGVTGAVNIYRAASVCCRQIATRFSSQADKTIGPAQLRASQKSAQYARRAGEWFERGRLWDVQPYAGGISVSDKWSVALDTDRVVPAFTRKMQTPPGLQTPIIDQLLVSLP